MISKEKSLLGKKSTGRALKTFFGIAFPVLVTAVTVFAILCMFEPAQGTNARQTYGILLAICGVLLVAVKAMDIIMRRNNSEYAAYNSKAAGRLDLGVMIPLLVMTLVVLIPFYIVFLTSVKHSTEANHIIFTWWPKEGFTFQNYEDLLMTLELIGLPILKSILNSFLYAFIPTIIGVFVSALSAYAFAKLRFPCKELMYSALIMTMMMPGCVTMSSSYLLFDSFGWTDSALPLIIPGCFGGATTVMFLREYYRGISDGMLEAARIDGAGKWRVFLTILLPLGKPAFIAQFILNFISRFNDFVSPLIYINDTNKYTIQLVLSFINSLETDQAILSAGAVMALAPMLILYLVFQKDIIKGISLSSGLKG